MITVIGTLTIWLSLVCSPLAAGGEDAGQVKLRLFAPAWRNIGDQRSQDVAKRFTCIYGHLAPGPFHEGNPQCKCLKYTLGPYVAKAMLNRLPGEAFVHDREGNVIKARDWANWIIVPDNPRWLEHVTREARRLMASDFDGLFVDSMGTAPVEGSYLLATRASVTRSRSGSRPERKCSKRSGQPCPKESCSP
jgi:hypothetical protein